MKSVLITAWYMLLYCTVSSDALMAAGAGDHPDCKQEEALACLLNAAKLASDPNIKCAWDKVIPDLQTCVDTNVKRCHTIIIENWTKLVADFKTSLQQMATDPVNLCVVPCIGETQQRTAVDTCLTLGNGYTTALTEIKASQNLKESCSTMEKIMACISTGVTCSTVVAYVTSLKTPYEQFKANCKDVIVVPPPEPAPTAGGPNKTVIIVVCVLVCIFLLVLLIVLIAYYFERKRTRERAQRKQERRLADPTPDDENNANFIRYY